jgi:uncharacterized protein YcbK (DUF882 family)
MAALLLYDVGVKRGRLILFFFLEFICLQVLCGGAGAGDELQMKQRFFRMGDGRIHIRNFHNGREVNIGLLAQDGSVDQQALAALDQVFGLVGNGNGEHISLRLLFLLDYFSDKVAPGRVIELYSGYRVPEYNQKLRAEGRIVALTSTHMDAMAIDFAIEGVAGKELWEIIRREECCGVGHYGGNTVHLDCGRSRFWEAATSGVGSGESQFNRRMYLSTEYDRYSTGEEARLILSSVSDYPFGVKKGLSFLKEGSGGPGGAVVGEIRRGDECAQVRNRSDGKSLRVLLPNNLPTGRYRVRIDFCNKPFPQMPSTITSNIVEVTPATRADWGR